MFIKKEINKKSVLGFTLIEVMVTLILSVLVSFFVYTMMMSSYTAFRRLSSVSKNANSIKFFSSAINNSAKNARIIEFSGNALCFERFDVHRGSGGQYVRERYFFSEGGNFFSDALKSTDPSKLEEVSGLSLGVLKKEVIVGGAVVETVVVSNVIRAIYYSITPKSATNRYRRLNLGIVYDDIIDGKQSSTGKLGSSGTGGTEIATNDTISRIMLCVCSRGIQW